MDLSRTEPDVLQDHFVCINNLQVLTLHAAFLRLKAREGASISFFSGLIRRKLSRRGYLKNLEETGGFSVAEEFKTHFRAKPD